MPGQRPIPSVARISVWPNLNSALECLAHCSPETSQCIKNLTENQKLSWHQFVLSGGMKEYHNSDNNKGICVVWVQYVKSCDNIIYSTYFHSAAIAKDLYKNKSFYDNYKHSILMYLRASECTQLNAIKIWERSLGLYITFILYIITFYSMFYAFGAIMFYCTLSEMTRIKMINQYIKTK